MRVRARYGLRKDVFGKTKRAYETVFDTLNDEETEWNARKATFTASDDVEEWTNPYSKLIGQMHGWVHQMPVIVFNSGKYDLNVIKKIPDK